jgi:hypothetical protein
MPILDLDGMKATAGDLDHMESVAREWAASEGMEYLGAEFRNDPEPHRKDIIRFRPRFRAPDGREWSVTVKGSDRIVADHPAHGPWLADRLSGPRTYPA